MTREEILEKTTMRDVLDLYGIHAVRGMCSCPFHGADRHPSMKIFPDGFHCFACGAHGDIFAFVQKMEGCDFKAAFLKLGGAYRDVGDRERAVNRLKWQRARENARKRQEREQEFKRTLAWAISYCRAAGCVLEPMSEDWCFFQDRLPQLLGAWEERYINGNEVREPDVYRICRDIGRRFSYER